MGIRDREKIKKLVDMHRAAEAPTSRAVTTPIRKDGSGECVPMTIISPRATGAIGHALETEAKDKEELAPNGTSAPSRARLPQSIAGIGPLKRPQEEVALNGISAPDYGEKKSWANGLTNGAQLVSVRVLRNTCQRHVTLNSKDQALWSCVPRRITKDLETGEVLADEDVTHMTKEELHRTLLRPRK